MCCLCMFHFGGQLHGNEEDVPCVRALLGFGNERGVQFGSMKGYKGVFDCVIKLHIYNMIHVFQSSWHTLIR